MKILATGDFHGDISFVEHIAQQADEQKADMIIVAGDIANWWGPTQNLIGPLMGNNKSRKVIIIPGNHDTFASADAIAEFYGITNLHGYNYQMGDVALFGCGGANFGLEALTEEEITNILTQSHERIKGAKRRIMVTHVHPSGTAMEQMTPFVPASLGVRKAIELLKPDIVICGHVHEASGIEEKIGNTRIINVAKATKFIDL